MKLIAGSLPVLCSLLVLAAMAQQPPAKRTFEVANVKLVDPNNSVFVAMSADSSNGENCSLKIRRKLVGFEESVIQTRKGAN